MAVLGWEMIAEDGFEPEPVEESVDEGQGADGVGAEGPPRGASDPAGPERWRGLLAWACWFLIHEGFPRCVLASMTVAAGRLPVSPP